MVFLACIYDICVPVEIIRVVGFTLNLQHRTSHAVGDWAHSLSTIALVYTNNVDLVIDLAIVATIISTEFTRTVDQSIVQRCHVHLLY